MYFAPNLVNGDYQALRLQHVASDGDATFYLPLARARSGSPPLAITVTSEERSRAEALALINRQYAWRGYGSDHQLSESCEETTFAARYDGHLISTVTLATDSDRGLAVDRTFPEEVRCLRQKQHARLCELKKLAMERGPDAKSVLASMFHFVFMYGTNNDLGTDLVIEVNPRHAAFYERMLKFRRVGAIRLNKSVDAPSQLMWLPVNEIDSAIINNENNVYDNSLYKYFYCRKFEDRIVHQLNEPILRDISDCTIISA